MKTGLHIFLGKITVVGILIMGLIHTIATFTPFVQEGLTCLSESDLQAMIYMTLGCGAFLILGGLLLILMLRKITQYSFLYPLILVTSILLFLGGILAIYYMSDNPFAWIICALCTIMLIITLIIKKKL